jgi:hypothetical protein
MTSDLTPTMIRNDAVAYRPADFQVNFSFGGYGAI